MKSSTLKNTFFDKKIFEANNFNKIDHFDDIKLIVYFTTCSILDCFIFIEFVLNFDIVDSCYLVFKNIIIFC